MKILVWFHIQLLSKLLSLNLLFICCRSLRCIVAHRQILLCLDCIDKASMYRPLIFRKETSSFFEGSLDVPIPENNQNTINAIFLKQDITSSLFVPN